MSREKGEKNPGKKMDYRSSYNKVLSRPFYNKKKTKQQDGRHLAFFCTSDIDGSRPESGRVFGKSGSRADSGRLFLIFFFFSKVGPTRAESKKIFKKKKKSARVEKKTRPESARVSPSRAESARLGSRRPPHSKIRVLACLGQWVKLTQVPGSRPTKKKKKGN